MNVTAIHTSYAFVTQSLTGLKSDSWRESTHEWHHDQWWRVQYTRVTRSWLNPWRDWSPIPEGNQLTNDITINDGVIISFDVTEQDHVTVFLLLRQRQTIPAGKRLQGLMLALSVPLPKSIDDTLKSNTIRNTLVPPRRQRLEVLSTEGYDDSTPSSSFCCSRSFSRSLQLIL